MRRRADCVILRASAVSAAALLGLASLAGRLEGAQVASRPPEDLARDQEKIARHTSDLANLLRQALEEQADNREFKIASDFMDKERIDARQQVAAQDLEQSDIMAAVAEQKESLRALKELAAKLSEALRQGTAPATGNPFTDLANDQKKVRAEAEAVPGDKFPDRMPGLAKAENDLKDRLDKILRDSAGPKTPPPSTGDKDKDLVTDRKGKPADDAAIAIRKAMEALGGYDKSGAIRAMKDAEQALGEMAGMTGDGRPVDDKQGNDKPHQADVKPGQNQRPDGRTPGANAPRQFVKVDVYGERPGEEGSEWSALSRRDRDALSENFARELPREYRELLKAYYETLARQ